ncbi:5237_t:CDS:2 [Racocetra fulgida]|uniref:Chromatin modification-related protein EAF6 n=1 Tax=Racocetra fulgida TaxID=60492 RepID=A0A9N9GZD3_9GLOM|nr:5237_t:CDS:2 [Racocetra fulgida]
MDRVLQNEFGTQRITGSQETSRQEPGEFASKLVKNQSFFILAVNQPNIDLNNTTIQKTIEKHIWNFEGSYLEETHSGGNLIRGFDGYLRAANDKKKRSEITHDLKSGYNKQIGPNLKKKRKQQRPTNYIYPQEVKEAKDREVRRIRLSVRDRDEKDTEEEVDI